MTLSAMSVLRRTRILAQVPPEGGWPGAGSRVLESDQGGIPPPSRGQAPRQQRGLGMHSTTKLKLAASLGLAATLAVAGCSGNGKSSTVSLSARAAAETATPAATGLKLDDHVT